MLKWDFKFRIQNVRWWSGGQAKKSLAFVEGGVKTCLYNIFRPQVTSTNLNVGRCWKQRSFYFRLCYVLTVYKDNLMTIDKDDPSEGVLKTTAL